MRTKALSAVALFTLLSTPALAQEPPPVPPPGEMPPPSAPPPVASAGAMGGFGSQGQIALSVDLPFASGAPDISIIHESMSMGGQSRTTIDISPAADYFIIPNLSIGGVIGVSHGSFDVGGGYSADGTGFIFGPRVGYNVRINDAVSIWPRLGIQYRHASFSSNGMDGSATAVPLIVDVPVLWHPAAHFFVGGGLLISTELSNSVEGGGVSMDQAKTTRIGLEGMVGGYF